VAREPSQTCVQFQHGSVDWTANLRKLQSAPKLVPTYARFQEQGVICERSIERAERHDGGAGAITTSSRSDHAQAPHSIRRLRQVDNSKASTKCLFSGRPSCSNWWGWAAPIRTPKYPRNLRCQKRPSSPMELKESDRECSKACGRPIRKNQGVRSILQLCIYRLSKRAFGVIRLALILAAT